MLPAIFTLARNSVRTLPALLAALVVLSAIAAPASAKYASIVIDANSGQTLYARNADTRNYPASLTKMMTLYLVFEALDKGQLKPQQKLKVSRRAAGQAPSKLGLKQGQTITVEDAIRALVVKSANDVATVVAEAISGTEVKFALLMTQRAREIGMRRTSFRNASGLPNRRQLSTARDMATLAKSLLDRFPHYYGYFSEEHFSYNGRKYRNHNALMRRVDEVDGIKTGYIRASGFNLVASAERGGHRLIGVVFGSKTASVRDRHMQNLLDRSWNVARAESTLMAQPLAKPEAPEQGSTDRPITAERAAVPTPVPPAPPQIAAVRPSVEAPKAPRVSPSGTLAAAAAPNNVSPRNSAWGIQVGAFSAYDGAQTAATNATKRLFGLPATATILIEPLAQGSATLYRARIMGLNERLAASSCRQLKRRGYGCSVVDPERDVQSVN